jgi:signal transduction histidine kinase
LGELDHVGLQETVPEILRAAVETGRSLLTTDALFAAVLADEGYAMHYREQLRSPGWAEMRIRPQRGLGGRVLVEGRPGAVEDYLTDTTITADFKDVVADEGIRGLACVPVAGPGGIRALLYAGAHTSGSPGGDIGVETLEAVAARAAIGIHHAEARARELELERLRDRQSLAMELHDTVAQMLFSIGVTAARARGERDQRAVAASILEIETTAADARRELRETLARISRPDERVAFESQLEQEVAVFRRATGAAVHLTRAGEAQPLTEEGACLVLNTVREGLRNAVMHLDARLAVVHFAHHPRHVVVCVQAERGPLHATLRHPGVARGVGLTVLRARAGALGGTLELSVGRRGATLRLTLPECVLQRPPLEACGLS